MTEYQTARGSEPVSGWAIGGIAFAATMMVLIGVFQVMQGLAAIIDDDFFVVADEYAFDLNVTAWGWIHLIVGVLVLLSGIFLFGRSAAAGAVAIMLASLAAISNFFFIPYYPFWSLLMIGIALWVIWSVTRPGALE